MVTLRSASGSGDKGYHPSVLPLLRSTYRLKIERKVERKVELEVNRKD